MQLLARGAAQTNPPQALASHVRARWPAGRPAVPEPAAQCCPCLCATPRPGTALVCLAHPSLRYRLGPLLSSLSSHSQDAAPVSIYRHQSAASAENRPYRLWRRQDVLLMLLNSLRLSERSVRQAAPFQGLAITLAVTKEDITRAGQVDLRVRRVPGHRHPGQAQRLRTGCVEEEGPLLQASDFQPSYSTGPCISDGQC